MYKANANQNKITRSYSRVAFVRSTEDKTKPQERKKGTFGQICSWLQLNKERGKKSQLFVFSFLRRRHTNKHTPIRCVLFSFNTLDFEIYQSLRTMTTIRCSSLTIVVGRDGGVCEPFEKPIDGQINLSTFLLN